MTSKSEQLRAVFLTALMLGSVFAAGIAFTGSAAAQEVEQDDLRKATHYVDSSDNSVLELAFNEGENASSLEGDTSADITLEFDGYDDVELDGSDVTTSGPNDERAVIQGSSFSSTGEVNTSLTGVSINGSDATDVTVAPETVDTTAEDTNDAYVGTNVALEGAHSDTFEIDSEEFTRNRGAGNGSEVYVLDTDDLETGEYNITNGAGDESVLNLENLGLSVEADEDSFETDENVTATAESNDLNRPVEAVLLDSSGDETDYTDATDIDSNGVAEFDFGEVSETGNYTVEVTDEESGVTAESDELEVTERTGVATEIVESPEVTRGDVATVNVSMTATDTATVVIGDLEEAGYQANITVVDEDGDGYAEFTANTYAMGEGDMSAYSVVDSDDASFGAVENESSLSSPIASGNYDITVRSGTDHTDNADDIAQFYINEGPNLDGQTMWTAPGGDLAIDEVVSDAPLSEDDSIAYNTDDDNSDYAVHAFDASGLYGVIEQHGQDSDTDNFEMALSQGNISMTLEQTESSTRQNRDPKSVDVESEIGSNNVEVVLDSENETFYVVTDIADLTYEDRDLEADNDVYNATFSLNQNTQLVDDNTSVSAEYSVVEEETELDYDGDELQLAAGGNASISGTSTLADGTEVDVRLQSDETEGEGYILTDEDVTIEDGAFEASVDLSDAAVNDTFTVEVTETATGDGLTEVSGTVVESVDNGTTTEEGTTAEETTTAEGTTAEETTSEGTTAEGTTAEETTAEDTTEEDGDDESGGGIPGFGMGIALIAIIGAALLALRQN